MLWFQISEAEPQTRTWVQPLSLGSQWNIGGKFFSPNLQLSFPVSGMISPVLYYQRLVYLLSSSKLTLRIPSLRSTSLSVLFQDSSHITVPLPSPSCSLCHFLFCLPGSGKLPPLKQGGWVPQIWNLSAVTEIVNAELWPEWGFNWSSVFVKVVEMYLYICMLQNNVE